MFYRNPTLANLQRELDRAWDDLAAAHAARDAATRNPEHFHAAAARVAAAQAEVDRIKLRMEDETRREQMAQEARPTVTEADQSEQQQRYQQAAEAARALGRQYAEYLAAAAAMEATIGELIADRVLTNMPIGGHLHEPFAAGFREAATKRPSPETFRRWTRSV